MSKKESVKKVGRPRKLIMPDPIPDTPENIAKAVLTTPPKKPHEWKYMQRREGESRSTTDMSTNM